MDDDDDGEEGIASTARGLTATPPPELERNLFPLPLPLPPPPPPQFTELSRTMLSARCFSAIVSGSERPRTGLLSPVSPNQKTGSAPYADWSTTATVNTVIGQSGRVTHGYRLPQQYLRSISPPWLPWPAARYLSLPYVYVTYSVLYNAVSPAAPSPPPPSPPLPLSRTRPRLAPITSG